MRDDIITFYHKIKSIHERIYEDELGGSQIKKCMLMSYLFKYLQYKTYIEIGVYRGKSLFTVAQAVKENKGHAYGIDPYLNECVYENDAADPIKTCIDNKLKQVDFSTLYSNVKWLCSYLDFEQNIEIIRDTSSNAIKQFANRKFTADMLHIDGNHDTVFVCEDAKNYIPLIKPGGVIIFDDIDWESVKVVYDEYKSSFCVLHEEDNYGILFNGEEGSSVYRSMVGCIKEINNLFAANSSWVGLLDVAISCNGIGSQKLNEIIDCFYRPNYNMRIYVNCADIPLVTELVEARPELKSSIVPWESNKLPASLNAKVVYFQGFQDVFNNIGNIETSNLPFIVELSEQTDNAKTVTEKERHICESPYLLYVLISNRLQKETVLNSYPLRPEQVIVLTEIASAGNIAYKAAAEYSNNLFCILSTRNRFLASVIKDYNHLQDSYLDLEAHYHNLQSHYANITQEQETLRDEYLKLKTGYDLQMHHQSDLTRAFVSLETGYKVLNGEQIILKKRLESKERFERNVKSTKWWKIFGRRTIKREDVDCT